MKGYLFAIFALTVQVKAGAQSLNCEALYGYKLQLTLENNFLKSTLIKLSDSVLLNSQVVTSSETQSLIPNVNLWKFFIPSQKRILALMLPLDLYQDSEVQGTFLIEAPSVSAEFPITCKIAD